MMQKKKERHIVTWTQEEDDILREIIELHGTENWTIIASKLKDKTTRQCRRRWYTYLNSDFKKGGWSPEEDLLLCEAQRIFGNRWTEISKVVSGRTDNAVKNRFTTLCKRRAKHEAMTNENIIWRNSNSKGVLSQEGFNAESIPEVEFSAKKMRRNLDYSANKCNSMGKQQDGTSCLEMARKADDINIMAAQDHVEDDRTFLKKNDPKIVTALMQQAELLSSLAQKVNQDNTDQSMETAWKVLQDFLKKSKENETFRYDISDNDFQLEYFKDLVEDLRSSKEEHLLSWRQRDIYESPASSESSKESTIMPNSAVDKTKQTQAETEIKHKQDECEQHSVQVEQERNSVSAANMNRVDLISGEEEFSSPVQVTSLFRTLAAGIPSPQFSESERNFLLKKLGIESLSPGPGANTLQPPTCKRVLLHSL